MATKRVLVIGLGSFGTALVETLWNMENVEVVAVDEHDEVVDVVKNRTAAAYVGDGTDPRVLEGVGARETDCAVVTFAEDFEASVLVVAALKKMGVAEIVARAADDRQADVLRTVGATRVLEVEREMGCRLATELTMTASSELLDFAHGYRVVPWIARGPLVGKTLAEAALRNRFDVTVLGYGRDTGARGTPKKLQPAAPDYAIREGDVLMLVGDERAISRFMAKQ